MGNGPYETGNFATIFIFPLPFTVKRKELLLIGKMPFQDYRGAGTIGLKFGK